jgi:hypothetical protein
VDEVQLFDKTTSFNFILKEHRKGVLYMGCHIEMCLYVVIPDEQTGKYNRFKTIDTITEPLCAILANDDNVIMIGGNNKKILYYSIKDEYVEDP